MTDSSGALISSIKYLPFGQTRSGSVPTDIKFTGQRLDDTGLYYYGARFYDPSIGRFISPDTLVPDATKPQALNRYSYVLNNPLKYVDPTGMWWTVSDDCQDIWIDDDTGEVTPGYEQIIKEAEGDKAQLLTTILLPAPTPPTLSLPIAPSQLIVPTAPEPAAPPAAPTGGTTGTGYNFNLGFGIGLSLEVLKVEDTEGNSAFAVTLSFLGTTPNASVGVQYQQTNAATIDNLTGWSGGGGFSIGRAIPSSIPSSIEYFGRNKGKEGGYDGTNIGIGPQRFPVEVHAVVGYTWLFGRKKK